MMDYFILCLSAENGLVEPLAYANRRFTAREGRKLAAKFMVDKDVNGWCQMEWNRLYNDIESMRKELPYISNR